MGWTVKILLLLLLAISLVRAENVCRRSVPCIKSKKCSSFEDCVYPDNACVIECKKSPAKVAGLAISMTVVAGLLLVVVYKKQRIREMDMERARRMLAAAELASVITTTFILVRERPSTSSSNRSATTTRDDPSLLTSTESTSSTSESPTTTVGTNIEQEPTVTEA